MAQNISLAEDLNKKSLAAFRQCVSVEERIYALDWQHQGYWFFPYHPGADNVTDWPFPVIPDGDYYIFIAEDFRFGSFGHPWEKTICVFGQRLLDVYRSSSNPFLFTEIIRKNGQPYGA